MNATDLARVLTMLRDRYTPEQVVTELERIHNNTKGVRP